MEKLEKEREHLERCLFLEWEFELTEQEELELAMCNEEVAEYLLQQEQEEI